MYDTSIELPLWVALCLTAGCVYAIVISIVIPGIRWYFRRRLNRAIEKLNERLQIRIRPFQRTKRQVLIDRLIYDAKVIEAIEEHAKTNKDLSRELLQARVYNYAREIVPAFNAVLYFQLGCWLARKISRLIYRVKVAAADYEQLESVDPEATVVFVMNHRSNIDYLLVAYLAARQVSLSYAVGEWARVFPLQTLIKWLGGFFVRRHSDDPLYRRVLERYVHMSTFAGVSQAVFIEGQLSRDGHLGEVKLGYLDYMVRDWDMTTDRDIVFVPIGINYDHVLEDSNMIAVANASQKKSKWQHTLGALGFLKTNLFASAEDKLRRYGFAGVNFGIPVSAQAFCRRNSIDFQHMSKPERFVQVEKLALELVAAIKHVMPVLPVPLIARVIEENADVALGSIDITGKVNQLIDDLMRSGSAMRGNEKPKQTTVLQSLTLLCDRGILLQNKDRFRMNADARELISYYANSIRHF